MSRGSGRAFWYVSRPKLEALSAEGPSWFDRVSFLAKLGFEQVGSIEAGIQPRGSPPSALPTVQKAVDRVEKRLRRENSLVTLDQVAETAPVRFFEYEGPTMRLTAPIFAGGQPLPSELGLDKAFWVAALSGSTGVLLVGSISNTIGTKGEDVQGYFSPSADPLGAVAFLFSAYSKYDIENLRRQVSELLDAGKTEEAAELSETIWQHEETSKTIPYCWEVIMAGRPGTPSMSSLPHTKGVVLYAGMQDVRDRLINYGVDKRQQVRTIVVGSPLWIEQKGP